MISSPSACFETALSFQCIDDTYIGPQDGLGTIFDLLMIDSLKIRIHFLDHEFPHEFIIEAGQRYPHIAPKICYRNHLITSPTSMDESFVCQDILPNWTPIMGLLDAICSIYKFREELDRNSCMDMHIVMGQEIEHSISDVHSA